MGFPCVFHVVILPSPLTLLLYLLHRITLAAATVLSYLGFEQVSSEILSGPWPASYFNQSSRSTTPAPITPSVMKSKLPVMEYASFLDRHCKNMCCPEEPTCVVCLGWLEAKDEIRKLGNCSHAFHKGCMDRWLDLGHVNCPLCRSPLLPLQTKGERLWSSVRNLPRFW